METSCRECQKIRECIIRHAIRNVVQDKLEGLIRDVGFMLVIERELPKFCDGFLDKSTKERPETTQEKQDMLSPGPTGEKMKVRHEAIEKVAASVNDYLADNPEANWAKLWRNVPNHYASLVGFMQAMKKCGIKLNDQK